MGHSFLFVNQDRWHEDGCEREDVAWFSEDSHSCANVLAVPWLVLLFGEVTDDCDPKIVELLCEIEELYLEVALRPWRWRRF